MAYVARPSDFHAAQPLPAVRPVPRRRGVWRTLIEAVTASHRRQTQQEIDRFVARRGRFTDSIEREIGERMMRGDWGERF
ncbi:MAG: hypothetical protein OJF62_001612 [Pseudolabrys sp.]|jgi:hypothetical protein|nr:hypothetical protein [Pseudolabrys sp.]